MTTIMYALSLGARPRFVVALAFALVLAAASCVSASNIAKTPAQRWYAAKQDYRIFLEVAVEYAKQPGADRNAVVWFAKADARARDVIARGDAIVQALPRGVTSTEFEGRIRRLELLTSAVRDALVKLGELDDAATFWNRYGSPDTPVNAAWDARPEITP